MNKMRYIIITIIASLLLTSCSPKPSAVRLAQRQTFTDVVTNPAGEGQEIELRFYGGPSLYYPLMAVWLEDEEGEYIQTLFVPRAIAIGVFKYGSNATGKWIEAANGLPRHCHSGRTGEASAHRMDSTCLILITL